MAAFLFVENMIYYSNKKLIQIYYAKNQITKTWKEE